MKTLKNKLNNIHFVLSYIYSTPDNLIFSDMDAHNLHLFLLTIINLYNRTHPCFIDELTIPDSNGNYYKQFNSKNGSR